MKLQLVAGAFLTCAAAQTGAVTSEMTCEGWAQNAMIGAERAMSGKLRKLMPLTVAQISELISHGRFGQVTGIPVLADQAATPEGRAFLEESVFYGFDYVRQLPAHERQQRFSTDLSRVFFEACPRKEPEPQNR
jgi:hypothetical protein